MFFTINLMTYSPKNRACAELIEWIRRYEFVLIGDELALDALKEEISQKVNEINKRYPKVKDIHISIRDKRISTHMKTNGCPDEVFILDYARVRSTYSFCEKLPADDHLIKE